MFFINDIFRIPVDLHSETKTVILLTAGFSLFIIPFSVFRNVILGLQRFEITSQVDFYISTLQLIFTVILLTKGFGLVTLILINNISAAISIIVLIMFVKKLLPSYRFRLEKPGKETVKDISKLSLSMFIINISSFIINKTDEIIIGIFLPIQYITYYAAGFKVYHGTGRIPLLLLQAIMPTSSEMDALKQKEGLKKIFFIGTRYTSAIMTPVAITAIIFAKDILRLWMGSEFEPYSAVIQILILNLFFLFLHQAGGQILIGLNRISKLIPYYILIMVSNLVISIILVRFMKLEGIAWGTTIPFIIFEYFYLKYISKYIEIPIRDIFTKIIFKVYTPGLVIAGLNLLCAYLFRFGNILILIAYFAAACLLYALLFYALFLNKMERSEIKMILKSLRRI